MLLSTLVITSGKNWGRNLSLVESGVSDLSFINWLDEKAQTDGSRSLSFKNTQTEFEFRTSGVRVKIRLAFEIIALFYLGPYLDTSNAINSEEPTLLNWDIGLFAIFFSLQFRANSKSKKARRYHQHGGNIRPRRREPFPLMFSWVSETKERVTTYLFPCLLIAEERTNCQVLTFINHLHECHVFITTYSLSSWMQRPEWDRGWPSRSRLVVVAFVEKAGKRTSLSGIGVQFDKKWRTYLNRSPDVFIHFSYCCVEHFFVTYFSIEIESGTLIKKVRSVILAVILAGREFFAIFL